MAIPHSYARTPSVLDRLVAGRPVRGIWTNRIGGHTWAIGEPAEEYLKVVPPHPEFDLVSEAERMHWTGHWLPIPEVINVDAAIDLEWGHIEWLHTVALPGSTAVARPWQTSVTIVELGHALRRLHDALPLADCPWTWSIDSRLDHIALHLPVSNERIGAMRSAAPSLDPVVCHGDACSPNFLIDVGRCTGYVDLGDLGIADRWADIAPALLSIGWNFGDLPTAEQHQTMFLDAYGIDLEAEKLDYYTRLWQLDDE